jgi:hypothetical protein
VRSEKIRELLGPHRRHRLQLLAVDLTLAAKTSSSPPGTIDGETVREREGDRERLRESSESERAKIDFRFRFLVFTFRFNFIKKKKKKKKTVNGSAGSLAG